MATGFGHTAPRSTPTEWLVIRMPFRLEKVA
jgi:hypothetical protein